MSSTTEFSRRGTFKGLAVSALPLAIGLNLGKTQLARAAEPVPTPKGPPPLSVYGQLPHIDAVRISPDAQRVALITTGGGQKIIADINLATKTTEVLGIEGSKLRTLMWVDNETVLAVTTVTQNLHMFVGGVQEWGLGLLLNLSAKKYFKLYAHMNQFASVVMGDFYRYKTEGGYRVTASNVRIDFDGFRCLYGFTPKNGTGLKLDEEPFDIQDWVVMPDGRLLGRSEFDRDTKLWTLRFCDKSKKWSIIYSEKDIIDHPQLKGAGRTDETLLVYRLDKDGSHNYYEIDSAGKISAPFEIDAQNSDPIYHPVTGLLAGFATHSDDGERYTYFDATMRRVSDLVAKALPDSYFNNIVSSADDPRKVIVYTEAMGDTGTYYMIDFSTGATKVIGQQYPQLPSEWVGEKKRIAYKAADGLEINGYITLPPNREPKSLAMVVLPHGGPQARDSIGFDWLSQAFASRGYLVLQANFRGSDGYGQAFVEAGHGQWGRKMQTDLSDGVRHLAKEGLIDPQKVAIVGASYGGYAALAGAAIDRGVYKCAVAIAGVSDLKSMVDWEYNKANRDAKNVNVLYWKRFMGDQGGWDEISPARLAAKIEIPVMLIHGKDDTVVPIEQSYRMRDAMEAVKKPVELVLLKAEDHWLSIEATRIQTLEASVGFVMQHNPA